MNNVRPGCLPKVERLRSRCEAIRTHLAEELLDTFVYILVRILELRNYGLGLLGESHGEWLGDRSCCGKGQRILADWRALYDLSWRGEGRAQERRSS